MEYPLHVSGAQGPALSARYPISVTHYAWLGKTQYQVNRASVVNSLNVCMANFELYKCRHQTGPQLNQVLANFCSRSRFVLQDRSCPRLLSSRASFTRTSRSCGSSRTSPTSSSSPAPSVSRLTGSNPSKASLLLLRALRINQILVHSLTLLKSHLVL